jgi:hyperosmotically inducible periplasmic protein
VEGKQVKTIQHIRTTLTAAVVLMGSVSLAGPTSQPRSLEDQVRHEILMVPYIGVFDNLDYGIDNGVVTLSGQVVRPVDKSNLERAVKSVNGVTAVNNQIEVLPLSPFDDQIRVRTLRTLLRTASLDKYFQGVQPSIRIVVKNGDVTLDGVVINDADRQIAYMAANGVPGVFSVTNNLRTEPRK